jgi:Flp pilus assembly protein TadG
MHIRAILRHYRERPLGQSLVEFALILPIFLVILSAAIDLGRLAYARVTIANVAREASFQAAHNPASYQAGQPCPTVDPGTGKVPETNMVICRAVLESKGSVMTVLPADVTLTCTPSCTEAMGHTVTVTATGHFNLLTPVMAVFFGGTTITFTSSATSQIESFPAGPSIPTPAATNPPTAPPSASPSPTPTATPIVCTLPSAGFTKVITPSTNKSPVSVAVTDTSTASASCPITAWAWDWGDGVTTYGQVQALPHVYRNTTGTPGNIKTFNLTLTVTNAVGSATSGVTVIQVVR